MILRVEKDLSFENFHASEIIPDTWRKLISDLIKKFKYFFIYVGAFLNWVGKIKISKNVKSNVNIIFMRFKNRHGVWGDCVFFKTKQQAIEANSKQKHSKKWNIKVLSNQVFNRNIRWRRLFKHLVKQMKNEI